jgi:hypothetical protein
MLGGSHPVREKYAADVEFCSIADLELGMLRLDGML